MYFFMKLFKMLQAYGKMTIKINCDDIISLYLKMNLPSWRRQKCMKKILSFCNTRNTTKDINQKDILSPPRKVKNNKIKPNTIKLPSTRIKNIHFPSKDYIYSL